MKSISRETRAFVLERDGYTCQMCGLAAGDHDPYDPAIGVRLTVEHIDKSKRGDESVTNLRVLCTSCYDGLQNISLPKPTRVELLKQVSRATVDDQLHLLEWLERKYARAR